MARVRVVAGQRTTNALLSRHRLDRLIEGKQVVVLDGPGGYGKTTFGEQLVTSVEMAAARVRLAQPTDGPGLLDAIVRACRRAGLNDLANSIVGPADGGIDRLLGAMAQRSDPVVLMIDEAQLLGTDGVQVLAELAGDLPDRCRLVIAGRGVATRRFGRPGTVAVLDAGDLAFDAAEAAAVLGVAVTDALVDGVMRATDGWPAAVALAAANHDSDPSWHPDTRTGGRRIVEALLDQLLADLPDSTRRWLGDLSRFPLLDTAVIDHVGGVGASATLIAVGLPTQHFGRWSVLPDAIREGLLGAGAGVSATDPEPVRWVAFHYAESGELAAATSLLAAEGDAAGLAELLAARHWSDLEALGLGTVRVLLDLVGDAVVDHPQAVLNAVRAADRRDPVLKSSWATSAIAMCSDGPVRRGLQAEIAIETVRLGEIDRAEAGARAVLDAAQPSERVTRGRALIALGMAHAFRSTPQELRSAEIAFDEAIANFALAGEVRWQAYALERSAYLVAWKRGAYARAAEQLEAAITLPRGQTRDRLTAISSYSEVLCALGRDDEARAAVLEALAVGRRWGDTLVIGFSAWALAWIATYREDAAAVRDALRVVEDNPGPWLDQSAGHELLVDGALMMTMLGDHVLRDHYMQRAAAHAHANADLMALLEARVAAVEGDPVRAVQQVEALEGTAYADPGQLWQRSLWLAAAELRAGNTTRAAELVRHSLHATAQLGLDDLPERFEGRLVRLLAPVWPRTDERAAKSLAHLTMLGDFALRRAGTDCTPTQGHGATLVKLLALRGASPTEQLIDTLWPDADLVTGRARLRNLLSRIRAQCGEIIERRADALALSDEVNVDVDDFERGAAEVLAADNQRRAGLARLVLDAHAGELLPADAYEDWAAGARERIKRRQLSLVDIVVDDAFDRGDLDDAVRSLDAAIAIEPLEEGRYVRMCEALLVQGRRATAREVGERASTMLEELGLRPGAALRAVLQRV
ncbi:MAG: hypothetical protein JWL72_3898 [Ilumatobacteraceae bacterium]|nr:hypothetical protein [Ilumatobacteraceae bacterium]